MQLKIEGLKHTEHALRLLINGEHMWVLGIGGNLIRFSKKSESSCRVSLYSVWREAMRFVVRDLKVDARVSQTEAIKLVEKLSSRPCKVVRNNIVDEPDELDDIGRDQISYLDYMKAVTVKGLMVQASP